MIIIIYVILLLVLSPWFCIVGFEIDEFVISETLLFMWFWAWVCYINTYVSAIDGMIIWIWHIYYIVKFELINEVKYFNFMKMKRKRNMVWTGLVMWNSLPGAYAWDSPTGLYVEEYDPRKIMKNLIWERSWMIWSEKDHGHFDPRKIMNISIRGRSQKSIRIKDCRMILVVQSQSQSQKEKD